MTWRSRNVWKSKFNLWISIRTRRLLATYYRVINAYNWPLRLSPIHFTHDVEMRWRLTFGNCLTHSTVMFRKDMALAVGGYDASVRAGEDAELYTRLMERGRVKILPYVLTSWRFHKKSLQQTEPTAYKIDFIKTVCHSLKTQLGEDVPLPVAAALFNQGIRPAESIAVFLDALQLVLRAVPFFNNQLEKPALERRFLARTVFLQLFDLGMPKIAVKPWWPTVEAEWKKALAYFNRAAVELPLVSRCRASVVLQKDFKERSARLPSADGNPCSDVRHLRHRRHREHYRRSSPFFRPSR